MEDLKDSKESLFESQTHYEQLQEKYSKIYTHRVEQIDKELDEGILQIYKETDEKNLETERNAQERAQKKIDEHRDVPGSGGYTTAGFIIGLVSGIGFAIMAGSFSVFLITFVGCWVGSLFLYSLVSSGAEQNNRDINKARDTIIEDAKTEKERIRAEADEAIKQLKAQKEEEKVKAKEACEDALYHEYMEYKRKTAAVCQAYIDQFNSGDNKSPIYKWLFETFREAILTADRSPHLRYVEIQFLIALDAESIDVYYNKKPKEKKEKARTTTFEELRMTSPVTSEENSFYEITGYASFLAQICQNMLLNAFKKDPLAPEGVEGDATVYINPNGMAQEIAYLVSNYNYSPAIRTAPDPAKYVNW